MTLIVTKEDRQAAASTVDAYRGHKDHDWQSRILLGECDAGEMVQAFARHRLKAIEATGVVELREALDMCRCIIKFHVKNAGVCCSFSEGEKPFSALDAYKAAADALALTQLAKGSE